MTGVLSDIEHELASAAVAMPWASFRRLGWMGVDMAFAGRLHLAGHLGAAQVSIGREGRFWEPDGPDARLLLGVREGGDLVDVAALSSTARDEWALRTGMGWVLGHDRYEDAARAALAERRTVLRVFSTPFDWLAGGGDGICVLDWNAAALGALRGLGERVTLEVDAGARERLKGLLAWGGLPRVAARDQEGRLAA